MDRKLKQKRKVLGVDGDVVKHFVCLCCFNSASVSLKSGIWDYMRLQADPTASSKQVWASTPPARIDRCYQRRQRKQILLDNINPHHQPRLLTCHTDNFLRQNCTLNTSVGWLNSEARAFRRLAQQSEEFGSGRKSGQRFSSELGTTQSFWILRQGQWNQGLSSEVFGGQADPRIPDATWCCCGGCEIYLPFNSWHWHIWPHKACKVTPLHGKTEGSSHLLCSPQHVDM